MVSFRRRILPLAVVLLALVAFASGCGVSQQDNGASPAQELTIGFTPDPVNLDNRFTPSVAGQGVSFHIVETLVFRDDDMNTYPLLAESWEFIDDLTLQIKLRQGVKFHNGEPFNAESVKWTLDDTRREDSKTWMRAMLAPINDVEVVDEYTVRLHTNEPYRPLVSNLALIGMLPAEAGAELGEDMATQLIGTGPYRLVEFIPGDRVVAGRNEDYWGDLPNPTKITWRTITEASTRISALETGEVDAINNVPPDQVERLEGLDNVRIESTPTVREVYLGIRNEREPFTNLKVRQALNYAINKEEIIEEIFAGRTKANQAPMPSGVATARDDLGPWPYDPDKARELLAEAGYGDGFELTFAAPRGRFLQDHQVAEAIAGYLSDVGIKVNLEILEWGVMRPEIYKGAESRFDIYMAGWGVSTADPDYSMMSHFHSEFAVEASGYANPKVDQLLEEGAQAMDADRMEQVYREVQELAWNDAPRVFLYEQPEIWAVRSNVVNLSPRSDELTFFHNTRIE